MVGAIFQALFISAGLRRHSLVKNVSVKGAEYRHGFTCCI